jgi:hypothetical protein
VSSRKTRPNPATPPSAMIYLPTKWILRFTSNRISLFLNIHVYSVSKTQAFLEEKTILRSLRFSFMKYVNVTITEERKP